MVPTERLTFRIGRRRSTGSFGSRAGRHSGRIVVMSRDFSRPWSCSLTFRRGPSGPPPGGAGLGVPDAHHDAAHPPEGGRGEAVLLRPQQGGPPHVAAGLHLAVHLDRD